jgi:hypothetical protein
VDKVVNPPRRISRRSIRKQQPNCLLLATTICADRECDYLDHGAAEGVRNEELFAAAVQCRDAGSAIAEAYRLLIPRAVGDGLSEAEARRTVDSAYSREHENRSVALTVFMNAMARQRFLATKVN